ncbi:hypothetical protein F4778DRAFT_138765 [Xylariomycetidae sp. FL2044]|nr:hypothetical protein F4778DRAFT_138765 [Xylariomycetidae sp. FL2044]
MSLADSVGKCIQLFRSICTLPSDIEDNNVTAAHLSEIINDSARFKLWSGNIGAHHKGKRSLEYRLRDSSHIRGQVAKLLETLTESLEEALAVLSGETPPWLESASDVEEDSDDDSVSVPDITELGFESELDQISDTIKRMVESLLRLSMSIRNPAPHDRFMSAKATDTSAFEPFDIQHVIAKYPEADTALAERLGKSISFRRQYFTYRKSHHEKLVDGLDFTSSKSEEQSTLASSVPMAIRDSVVPESIVEEESDGLSDAGFSQTSFATTMPGSEKLRVPPMPNQAMAGPFECPFCYMLISVSTTYEWERHVYSDLRPYVCLESDCSASKKDFERRCEWMQHFLQTHWIMWACPYSCQESWQSPAGLKEHIQRTHPSTGSGDELDSVVDMSQRTRSRNQEVECPLCRQKMNSLSQYQRHVGRHQADLALFALPQLPYDAEDEDGGDISVASSVSGESEIMSGDVDMASLILREAKDINEITRIIRAGLTTQLLIEAGADYRAGVATSKQEQEGQYERTPTPEVEETNDTLIHSTAGENEGLGALGDSKLQHRYQPPASSTLPDNSLSTIDTAVDSIFSGVHDEKDDERIICFKDRRDTASSVLANHSERRRPVYVESPSFPGRPPTRYIIPPSVPSSSGYIYEPPRYREDIVDDRDRVVTGPTINIETRKEELHKHRHHRRSSLSKTSSPESREGRRQRRDEDAERYLSEKVKFVIEGDKSRDSIPSPGASMTEVDQDPIPDIAREGTNQENTHDPVEPESYSPSWRGSFSARSAGTTDAAQGSGTEA